MSKRSRRSRQLGLPIREKFAHGGRRKGAGRPKRSTLQPHVARRDFQARHPLHVTIRLKDGLPSLRSKESYRSLKRAVSKARERGLHVAHFAILSNHLHLILEASGREALGKQMQSLGISLAKRLNQRLGRKGAILRERYHVHVLKTPSEVRHALAYVLSNAYKHAGRRGRIALDSFSSALTVSDACWRHLLGRSWRQVVGFPEGEDPEEIEETKRHVYTWVCIPQTWLLREGWSR